MQITLRDEELYTMIMYSSTKEKIEEIAQAITKQDTSKYPFIHNVFCMGEIAKTPELIAKELVPIFKNHEITEESSFGNLRKKKVTEYRCYGRKEYVVNNNLIVHEDAVSALKCAASLIGSPKYVYVLKISK